MNPSCWYCNRYVQEEPDHFNKEGECLEQLRDQAESRRDFWREALAEKEDHRADEINKQKKENVNLCQPTFDKDRHHWGG